jgi:choline dehydrogenase-like flavoprotein
MEYDFDTAGTVPRHSDVCVVGAGAAGLLLATRLSEMGCSVTLLEGGGHRQEARSQKLYRGEITGLSHEGLHLGRFRAFGGSTTQWGGQILELADFDFEPRRHVEGSGWPFSKSVLKEYYERALHYEGLGYTEREDTRVHAALGLKHLEIGPEFSLVYSRHCRERDFAGRHTSALAQRETLCTFFHANVIGLNLSADGSAIASANVRGFSGREAQVTAERFVICLGGIESTRLLLQPLGSIRPAWQLNGVLGRFFQDHILLDCLPLEVVSPQPTEGHFGCAMLDGFQYRAHIHLSFAAQAAHETLDVAGTINPFQKNLKGSERAFRLLSQLVREGKLPALTDLAREAPYIPKNITDILLRRLLGEGHAWKRTMLTLHCEQSPRSASRISLSDRRDRFGMQITKLHWEISDQEIHSLRTFARLAQKVFARSQLGSLNTPDGFFEDDDLVRAMCGDSYHHMGGCLMSDSPLDGIVDKNLRLHGIANGYVCSASVFPTSGFSNPTHTLWALTMRLSDHLVDTVRRYGRQTEVTSAP